MQRGLRQALRQFLHVRQGHQLVFSHGDQCAGRNDLRGIDRMQVDTFGETQEGSGDMAGGVGVAASMQIAFHREAHHAGSIATRLAFETGLEFAT